MKYLLMCCFEEKLWQELPESTRGRIMDEYGAWQQNLKRRGQYLTGVKLGSGSTGTTVRLKNGKPAITDGPFVETKEQIGGFHLIECRHLDEAISIALRIPTLPAGGTVEVRPVEHTIQV